jgi:4-hydroxy-tetrahydrodipicolinate synthase
VTTAGTTRRARHAQRAGTDAVMMLPVSYWKLSEGEILKHSLSIGRAMGIPMMMYKNPATSGVDMRPELLTQMFETIDNVTMVKGSTGDLSRMKRIESLNDRWLPLYNGSNPLGLGRAAGGRHRMVHGRVVSATAAVHRPA